MRQVLSLRARMGMCIAAMFAVGAAAVSPSALGYGPGCPYCDPNALGTVVSPTDPMLFVSVKWSGISQAPSIGNPSLACQSNFKTMLWRRHERASDCVLINQGRFTMRSGGAIQQSDYLDFGDLDLTIGNPGDINVVTGTEMDDTWEHADLLWSAQPKGVIAVSCNRLVDGSGTSVARGVAYVGSITRPWLAVADPDVLCQLNERTLAHELGHVLGLGHVSTAGNLMQTGGTGAALTLAQIQSMRNYIVANPIVDPPPGGADRNLVDFLFNSRGRLPDVPFANLFKLVAHDFTPTGGDVLLTLGTDGVLPTVTQFEPQLWIALDTDNDPTTGRNANELAPGLDMTGVDFVVELRYTRRDGAVPTLWRALAFGFVPLEVGPELLEAQVSIIPLVLCDPFPVHQPFEFLPRFDELDVRIGRTLLGLPQQGGAKDGAFPRGLRARFASALMPGGHLVDIGPPVGRPDTMMFPRVIFPSIAAPARVQRGQTVEISVSDMPPSVPLGAFFGQHTVPLNLMSDGDGAANFPFTIPMKSPFGPTLTTIGVDQGANAVTADTVITVVPCLADLDGDGIVSASDLAILLGDWGLFSVFDMSGDGVINAKDLSILLGSWGRCPAP